MGVFGKKTTLSPSKRFFCVGFMATGSNYFHLLRAVYQWVMDPTTVIVDLRSRPHAYNRSFFWPQTLVFSNGIIE